MSNNIKEIQIQTIIDRQTFSKVRKCLESVTNAIRVCNDKDVRVRATIRIGILKEWAFENELREFISGVNEDVNVKNYEKATRYHALHDMIKKSNAKYDMVINSDIILEAESIYRMLCNPRIDDAIIEAKQTPIELGKVYDEKTGATEWASDVCMMIPHNLYSEINGFDFEHFHSCYGNIDLCLRARLKGYLIVYDPSIMVYNPIRVDKTGCSISQEDEIIRNRDKLFFLEKWGNDEAVQFFCGILEEQGKGEAVQLYKQDKEGITYNDIMSGKKNYANFANYDFCDMRF